MNTERSIPLPLGLADAPAVTASVLSGCLAGVLDDGPLAASGAGGSVKAPAGPQSASGPSAAAGVEVAGAGGSTPGSLPKSTQACRGWLSTLSA